MDTKDIDLGYRKIIEAIENLSNSEIQNGIFGGKNKENKESIAFYALVNEFGSKDGKVPQRSFIRSTIDGKSLEYNNYIEKQFERILEDSQTVDGFLLSFALKIEGDIKKKIVDLKHPPNAPSTMLQKGKSVSNFISPSARQSQGRENVTFSVNNPLVDTMSMFHAVDHKVIKKGETLA